MNKNTKNLQLIFLFSYLIFGVSSQTLYLPYCTSYGGTNLSYFKFSYFPTYNYRVCTGCEVDTFRTTNTNNCECDIGYYQDGTGCREMTPGILFQDDFEETTFLADNWVKGDRYPNMSAQRYFNTEMNSNVIRFTRGRSGGDIFTNRYFQGLKHNGKLRISFDYSSNSAALFALGRAYIGAYPPNHSWPITSIPSTPGTSWTHFEIVFENIEFNIPVAIMLEDFHAVDSTVINRVSLDNFMVTTVHGVSTINIGAYTPLYPSFMILSDDYAGYDGSNNLQQFNFEIDTMNQILGKTNWNNEQFAIFIPETNTVAEVILYDQTQYNGGFIGKGHGRFKNNASFTTQKYFNPGQYLYFDENFSTLQADFEQKTGTVNFEGPLINGAQNLDGCFNNCEDFENFQVAVAECMKHTGCHGVKYTHKLWGGSSSQGFNHGYGYQLRSNGPESNTRDFEFSYKKRIPIENDIVLIREECKNQAYTSLAGLFYTENLVDIKECTICSLSDPNRKNQLPLCECKDNYYDDGTICRQRQIGVIYEDDFNTGSLSDSWNGNYQDSYVSQAQYVPSKFGSDQCISFPQIRPKGDLFYKKMYQTQQYNEEMFIMFDYIDEGNAGLGFGFSYMYPGNYKLVFTTSVANAGTTYESTYIPKSSSGKWSHFEGTFQAFYQYPFRIMFQEIISTSSESFLDNYVLSTIHGPSSIRKSPYHHLQPALMIHSNDFPGFDGSSINQQFSFQKSDLETILGRPLVNGESFFVYLERTQSTEEVQFFDTSNGSIFGDAYGKFTNPSTHSGSLVFKPGDWIIFSNNLAKTLDQFKLETGTCQFDGPIRNQDQNLEGCFDDCKDFATLEEAMQRCLTETLCDGVTYSHKLWGGVNSVGFSYGYGYQVRTSSSTPSRNGFDRKFEYSFKKKSILGKFQEGDNIQCTDCSHKCKFCVSSATNCLECSEINRINDPICDCKDGYFENSLNQCEQCDTTKCSTCQNNSDECIIPCESECNLCNTTDTCLVIKNGYFRDPIDNQLKSCSYKCNTCQTTSTNCLQCSHIDRIASVCDCKPGTFENLSQLCQECDSVCATCHNSPTDCIIHCDPNCIKCDTTGSCLQIKEGYFKDPSDGQIKKCNNKICATCTTSADSCDLPCDPTCSICDIDSTCITCAFSTVLKNGTCKTCNPKCLLCSSEDQNTCQFCVQKGIGRSLDITKNCACKEGYYEDPVALNCVKCETENCSICSQNYQICKKCTNEELTPPLCVKVKKGYYIDLNKEEKIQQCDIQCETCTNSRLNCSVCRNGLFRKDAPYCTCMEGYHDDFGTKKDCEKCPKGCLQCLNEEICTLCSEDRVMNEYTNFCECKLGFKLNKQTFVCEPCYAYKGQCIFTCPDNSLLDSSQNTCIEIGYNNMDNKQLIWICSMTILIIYLFLLVIKRSLLKKMETTKQPQQQNQQRNIQTH